MPRQRRWLPLLWLGIVVSGIVGYVVWGLLRPFFALLVLPGPAPWQRQVDTFLGVALWLLILVAVSKHLIEQFSLDLDDYGIGQWGWLGWRWLRWPDVQVALRNDPLANFHGPGHYQSINIAFFADREALRAAIIARLPTATRTPSIANQVAIGQRVYYRSGPVQILLGLAFVWLVGRARQLDVNLLVFICALATGILIAWRGRRPWLEQALPTAMLPGPIARAIGTFVACLPVILAMLLVEPHSAITQAASANTTTFVFFYTTSAASLLVRGMSEWQLAWVIGRANAVPPPAADAEAQTAD